MKQENRLKKRKQFKWTFKNGKSITEKDIVIIFVKSKTKDTKIGFSVTKKVGKAVVRNKKKRQMREVVSKHIGSICDRSTIIFVAKPSIVEADFFQIEKQILSLIEKTGLKKSTESTDESC